MLSVLPSRHQIASRGSVRVAGHHLRRHLQAEELAVLVDSGVFGRLHLAFSLYPACAATPGLRRQVVNGNVCGFLPEASAELHPVPSLG